MVRQRARQHHCCLRQFEKEVKARAAIPFPERGAIAFDWQDPRRVAPGSRLCAPPAKAGVAWPGHGIVRVPAECVRAPARNAREPGPRGRRLGMLSSGGMNRTMGPRTEAPGPQLPFRQNGPRGARAQARPHPRIPCSSPRPHWLPTTPDRAPLHPPRPQAR
jgi:hypothetical protein